MGGLFKQSLVARRQQAHCISAATVVEFEPEHFQQSAGLVCYYNSTKFHYLHLSHDETHGKHLRVMSCIPDSTQADAFTPPMAIPAGKPVHLRVEIDYERLHFAYRVEGVDKDWQWLEQQFDASLLSDEAAAPGQFKATLGPYQRQGVNWLCFLNGLQFGALPADDMGLGKTVELLAMFSVRTAECFSTITL